MLSHPAGARTNGAMVYESLHFCGERLGSERGALR